MNQNNNHFSMSERQTLSILFYLRKDKGVNKKETPIYMRITVNGQRAELTTHRRIIQSKWNSAGGFAKGTKEEAKSLNNYLDILRNKVYEAQRNLIEDNEQVTALLLRNGVQGKAKKQYSLLKVFEFHNSQMASEVNNKHYAPATIKRYNTTLKHIKAYIFYKYGTSDLFLSQLNHEFVTGLEHYFKVVKKCNHNTSIKYIKNLRKIINLAYKNDWIRKDPFAGFTVKIKPVKREYLTDEELGKIENLKIAIPRLETVRDIFVFSCYTGFSYTDVESLTSHNIRKGIDGELWIFTDRIKTTTKSNVPLLPIALDIIEKYKDHPVAVNNDKLLPVISNQKLNAYLKEIADLAGINKNMTFHLARHTFATTVTLSNDVPIETVSEMLGHKSIRTTQIYAKVIEKKVSKDMNRLKSKLKKREGDRKII